MCQGAGAKDQLVRGEKPGGEPQNTFLLGLPKVNCRFIQMQQVENWSC